MSTVQRGAFIVIEGLDRSGKSTQAALLQSRLQNANVSVKLMKFPDRTTPVGKMIDAYLRSQSDVDDRTIHLLFSANRWEAVSSIESTLAAGTTIICDRYAFSGVAFSAAKGLPLAWCRSPDVSLPAPDLTLFLDISPDIAKSRGGYGEERYEKEELQRRVRNIFHQLGDELPKDGAGRWAVIDAGRDLNTVSESLWHEVAITIHDCTKQDSVGKLWQS
ncbi:thymidylate kinase [Rickenella mellea]|uniref:Thymidylate kinase n=1 Tax=Rickenella mellea TaxID=50990 RepID=A0A4Y7Q901_9AGAM|nr:thymidylate kinase [Rickenella mellea]